MKSKRIASLILAVVMVMALAVPAFADDSAEMEVTGTTTPVTINVTVPTSDSITLNPYGISVGGKNDQVIYTDNKIENTTAVPVQVSMTVTGSIPQGSKAAFATAPIKFTELTTKTLDTKKEAFLALQIQAIQNASSVSSAKWAKLDDYIDSQQEGSKAKFDLTKVEDYNYWGTTVIVGAKAVTAANVVTLAAATKDGTAAAIRLFGDVAGNSSTVWTEDDTVAVKIAFTFLPVTNGVTYGSDT